MNILRIGVVGCGNISGIYFRNLQRFEGVQVLACSDLDQRKAEAAAQQHHVPLVLSNDELITHPDVDLVLNLTVPKAHGPISLQAVRAGKHVYSEKPLAVTYEEGQEIVAEAKTRGVRVGCAPDTFLGGAHQTCRGLIDSGTIGEPVGAAAFMLCHGHESWHPSPEFFYEPSGGPMMDMGPYYVTAFVNMLGPVRAVTGMTRITFPERTITSEPRRGAVIKVETPTHIAGAMEFQGGTIATIVTSFDVWHSTLPCIELWGTEGSLLVPDPNGFGGKILLKLAGQSEWSEVPVARGFTGNARGIGLVDMVLAIAANRTHRASGDLALHVLETMLGFGKSADTRRFYEPTHTISRPEALQPDLIAEVGERWEATAGT